MFGLVPSCRPAIPLSRLRTRGPGAKGITCSVVRTALLTAAACEGAKRLCRTSWHHFVSISPLETSDPRRLSNLPYCTLIVFPLRASKSTCPHPEGYPAVMALLQANGQGLLSGRVRAFTQGAAGPGSAPRSRAHLVCQARRAQVSLHPEREMQFLKLGAKHPAKVATASGGMPVGLLENFAHVLEVQLSDSGRCVSWVSSLLRAPALLRIEFSRTLMLKENLAFVLAQENHGFAQGAALRIAAVRLF